MHTHVTSLELSRRLEKAGVPQKSFFRWEVAFGKGSIIWEDYHKHSYIDTADVRQYYSAYLSSEIGEMLPSDVYFFTGIKNPKRRKHPQHLHIFHGRNWMVNYTGGGARENYTQQSETLADALGKMLEYLLINGLITL